MTPAYLAQANRLRVPLAAPLRRVPKVSGTTRIERFFLMALGVLFPLENHIPTLAGFICMYILFVVAAGYVLLYRCRALSRMCVHPVFLAAYGFLGVAVLVESFHPDSSYFEIYLNGLMFGGAIVFS